VGATEPKTVGEAASSYLEEVGGGVRIPVPDEPDGERAAVAAHPAFRALLAEARRERAAGQTVPAEAVYAELGAPPSRAGGRRRPSGRRAPGESGRLLVRLPARLHRELVGQAAEQGVSVNTLVVAYLAREAGLEAARGTAGPSPPAQTPPSVPT
jgi:hypothetical protein